MQEFLAWEEALRRGVAHKDASRPLRVEGLQGGARAYFVSRVMAARRGAALLIAPDGRSAERRVRDLRFLHRDVGDGVHHLPSWDVVPFEDVSPPAEVVAARLEALHHLATAERPLIVTTPDALFQRVPPRHETLRRQRTLGVGEDIDRDELLGELVRLGYRRVPIVEDRGDFSARGEILDVFPSGTDDPVRVQLDFETIDSIYVFDPASQRSTEPLSSVTVLPVTELGEGASRRATLDAVDVRARDLDVPRTERHILLDGLRGAVRVPGVEMCLPYCWERLDTVFDYLGNEAVLFVDDPGGVHEAAAEQTAMIERRIAERSAEQRFFPPPESLYLTASEWENALRCRATIAMSPPEMLSPPGDPESIAVRVESTGDLRVPRVHARAEPTFGPVAERMGEWLRKGERVEIVAAGESQRNRLAGLLEAHGIETDRASVLGAEGAGAGRVRLLVGHLSAGFRLPDAGRAVVSEVDLFGEARRRAARPVSVGQLLRNLSELQSGDFVVHVDHGIGRYQGLRHMRVAGTEGDYLHLEYAKGDRMYVPADRIALVQKYVGGGEDARPTLDRLGGGGWEKVKRKARESVLAMARELLGIHAAREIHQRRPYAAADGYFAEFEAAFPFEETPDQRRAIEETLSDLQRPRPMDRLICGDVGYGKTEVAMRAAFLAVMDGRQVAVLVPTTVLGFQHFNTFRERFDGYPVRIEMLSRFVPPSRSREVLDGLRNGSVDIVIGTHRLLQRSVSFKRLGLLVVDEEHRFGVRHKERIKEMRMLVDVLTLTATPIPRTLQMSLTGIRELSVIETPPVDRQAIRTYVTRFDEDLIRDAIRRERRRGGQVFFVHNRVESIDRMADFLRRLVPEARFAIGHGQMNERELEHVMLRFMRQEVDVLVCSTIIESGLDIPRANTLIVNRADRFGLAQLYQIRGRVGRSSERAYAYLMIPGEDLITRDAQRRLRVLRELDELGGGFRLATHDLEIRGAGNLLGQKQSGHVAAVGFELYTQMLEEAVAELRGERYTAEIEPEMQLGFAAFIPDTYIDDETQRLVLYRRLAAAEEREEIDAVAEELRDRYGSPPELVDNLLQMMDLRRILKGDMVVRAAQQHGEVTLQFHPEAPMDADRMLALAQSRRGRYRISQDFLVRFRPEARDIAGLVREIGGVLDEIRTREDTPMEAERREECRV